MLSPVYKGICAKEGCFQAARPRGKAKNKTLCNAHHAAAMRFWRKRQQKAGKPIAGASKSAPSSSAEAVRKRMQLSRARRRGTIVPQPCGACRNVQDVVATHPDAADPQKIVWACRRCRIQLVRKFTVDVEDLVAPSPQPEPWSDRIARCDRELPLLPPETQAAIREAASRGPAGIRISPTAPLYRQFLVLAFERHVEEQLVSGVG